MRGGRSEFLPGPRSPVVAHVLGNCSPRTSASSKWPAEGARTPWWSRAARGRADRWSASWPALGRRVVGIAGGPEKVAGSSELGFDAAIDYKADDVMTFGPLARDLSEQRRRLLRQRRRRILRRRLAHLGAQGGDLRPHLGLLPSRATRTGFLMLFSARMEGFLVSDYVHRFGEDFERLGRLLADGWITTARL